ncbi:MAG TPA: sigma-70 family RNA polymerase sigma factor [Acidimicrobiales bacterium]|nr:sigma-70 family RNA polymerase sigma factor [Acidimicrobiales bacterium]
MDDAALVLRARDGDREALAAIYDRYGDRLHDFCTSILRDRQEAADAFHDAFVVAAQRLGQLREPSKLRPWLFAIARHEALRRAKARARQQPSEELEGVSADDADLGGGVRREEASRLVWAAAAGLSDRDRALLDLNLRHGLEGQDLADAIGVEAGHAYVLLSRLRDQVERSLGALLVARYGRRDCPELAGILKGWDGRFSPLIRKRVARHADSCDVCAGRRRALASPLALLGAMPLVPCPPGLRDRILGDARLAHHGDAWPEGAGGFPPPLEAAGGGRRGAAAVAAVVALVVAAVILVAPWGNDPEGAVPVAAGPAVTTTLGPDPVPSSVPSEPGPSPVTTDGGSAGPETTGAGGTPPTTTAAPAPQPPPAAPASLRLGAGTLVFGRLATEQRVALANDGGSPLEWSAAASPSLFSVAPASGAVAAGSTVEVVVHFHRADAPEGDLIGEVVFTSSGGGGRVALSATVRRPPEVRASTDLARLFRTACTAAGPTVASVTAVVTDEAAVRTVTLRWRDPSGRQGSAEMVAAGGAAYSGRLGPFADEGVVTWWVEATDSFGESGRSPDQSLPVETCRAAG